MMQIFCFLSYFYLLILASIWTLACNNYYCGVCLRVIFYFLHSVYIYQLEFECNKSHPFSFIYLFNYLFILLCTIDYNPIYQLCHCWHWPRFGHQNSSSCSLMFSPFSSISFHFGSTRYSRIVSYFSYIDLGIHSSSKSSFFFFFRWRKVFGKMWELHILITTELQLLLRFSQWTYLDNICM